MYSEFECRWHVTPLRIHEGCRTGPQTRSKKNKRTLWESTFYTHMWGFAKVSGFLSTVLRVYGPILRHSHGTTVKALRAGAAVSLNQSS